MDNIRKIHDYLNQNPKEVYTTSKISDIFKKYLEENLEISEDEKLKVELEQMICSFLFQENEAKPRFTWTDPEDGIQRSYPHINVIKESHIKLIEDVFKTTKSYLYKATSGHLLYILGNRHNDHASVIYENYFQHVSKLFSWVLLPDVKRNVLLSLALEGIQHLLFFSSKAGREKDLKEFLKKILVNDDYFGIRYNLIAILLETKKFFDINEFKALIPSVIFDANQLENDSQKIRVLGIGQRIDSKCRMNSYDWFYQIAKVQEFMAIEQGGVGGMDLISSALKAYEKSGTEEDINRANKIYEEFKKSDFLKHSKNEIDITSVVKQVDELLKDLDEYSLSDFITYIALSKDLVPDTIGWEEAVQQVVEYSPIRLHSTNIIYDRNGNIAERYIGPKNSVELIKKETFSTSLRFSLEVVISKILPKLYSPDKWKFEDVITELSKGWYGQNVTSYIRPGEEINFQIIELILPGLRHYYEELSKCASIKDYQPDYTLTVDSLAVKLEALLRIFCSAIGIRTTYIKLDEYNKEIVREKDINTLLREEKLGEVLQEPMLQMLKTILIERVGLNLRNRVAHGFLMPIEYKGLNLANCLIFLIIRLSIWKLRDEE